MAPRGGDWVGTLERFREKRTGNTAAPGTFLYVWLISGTVSCCWGGPASAEQPLDFFCLFFNRSILEDSAVFQNIFLFL